MEQRENLCCPDIVTAPLASIDTAIILYVPTESELPTTLAVTVSNTSAIVSWMPPPYSPDYYNVSYSCQLSCNSSSITQGSVTVLNGTTTHSFSSLPPGSNCTISVVAVYDGIGTSNTVFSTINTTQGTIIVFYVS